MRLHFTAFDSLNVLIDIVGDLFDVSLIMGSTFCVLRFDKVLWLGFWGLWSSWFCDFLLKIVFYLVIFLLLLFFFFLLFWWHRLRLNGHRFWLNDWVKFLIALRYLGLEVLWFEVLWLEIFLLFDFWRLLVSFRLLLFDELFGGDRFFWVNYLFVGFFMVIGLRLAFKKIVIIIFLLSWLFFVCLFGLFFFCIVFLIWGH